MIEKNLTQLFSEKEKEEIFYTIKSIKEKTSGDIKIFIGKKAEKDPLKKAREIFHRIGMRNTKLHNGVLFFISLKDKKFVVLGDDGISEKVKHEFWENIKDAVIEKFKNKEFSLGVIGGVNLVGEKLIEYFPLNDANNKAELKISDIILYEE